MATWMRWLGVEVDEVSTKEKAVSGLGGFVAIGILMLITRDALDLHGASMVIASMGASAVLLFAVPHGQLSQPWPVVAGHVTSALIGVTAAEMIGSIELAAAVAVGAAIGAMHVLKCIHPPGGATALTAVVGGPAVYDLGFQFVVRPVLLNAVAMVMLAVAFNAMFAWRRYPAAANKPSPGSVAGGPSHADVLAALRSIDSFVDITETDLVRLVALLSDPVEEDQVAISAPRPTAR
ncbi:MAG: HPP family protein [Ilumatobacter sp.]|uniref:HPP family protein n=1 Tax=Ilumatobacter sp. TaxID=1967498 RepID=UPI003297FCDC